MTKLVDKYPFFLFLVPILFFLVGYTEHGYFLHFTQILPAYLLIYGCIFSAYFLLNFFSQKKRRNSLLVFYFASTYLFFGNIKDTFNELPWIGSYTFFVPILFIFPFVIHFYLKGKNKTKEQIFTYCNVLLPVLCVIQFFIIPLNQPNPSTYELQQIKFLKVKELPKSPSIHFIIWDAYPGFISLSNHFNFKNEDIKEFLKKNEYLVFDTIHSNYFQTQHSINSILNLQYLPYLKQFKSSEFCKRFFVIDQLNENQVVKFLKEKNYQIYNNSIFKFDNQAEYNQNLISKSSEYFHFRGILHQRLITDQLWRLGIGANKIDYFYQKMVMRHYHQNNVVINKLMRMKLKKPHFTYTHIVMPHEPYYTDSMGNFIETQKAFDAGNEELMISYLKFTNKTMKKIVNHVAKSEPNSIIILMSDHGYRNYLAKKDQHYKFNNFMAVKFPDLKYDSIKKIKSNVNLFRVIFNQYFQQNLPILKDRFISIDE